MHLQHQLAECGVERLLFLARGSAFYFGDKGTFRRVLCHDIRAPELGVYTNGHAHFHKRGLGCTRAFGFVGFVLTALCPFHSVNIDTHPPAPARRKAVRNKPTLHLKLIQGCALYAVSFVFLVVKVILDHVMKRWFLFKQLHHLRNYWHPKFRSPGKPHKPRTRHFIGN